MNKVEFCDQVAKLINNDSFTIKPDDYATIEYVYTWHPSIDAVKGKQQIAYLYVNFGMALINDMMNTAVAAQEAEQAMLKAQAEYEAAKARYEKLKKQGTK